MRMKLWLSAAVLVAGAMTASLPANADPNWSGPGYYDSLVMGSLLTLLAGPYSTEDECKSHVPPEEAQYCTYYATDPTPDDK